MPRLRQKRCSGEAELSTPASHDDVKKIKLDEQKAAKATQERQKVGRKKAGETKKKEDIKCESGGPTAKSSRYFSKNQDLKNSNKLPSATNQKTQRDSKVQNKSVRKQESEKSSREIKSEQNTLPLSKKLVSKSIACQKDETFNSAPKKSDLRKADTKIVMPNNSVSKTDPLKKSVPIKRKVAKASSKSDGHKIVDNSENNIPNKLSNSSKSSKTVGKKVHLKNSVKSSKKVAKPVIDLKEKSMNTKVPHLNHQIQKVGKMTSDGSHDDTSESDSSESEWEEVEDIPENKEEMLKSQLPDQPVQITLDAPIDFFQKKRKKKQFDMEAWFKRQMNRYKKELRINMHKVHLLCLLSHGFHVNGFCLNPVLQAVALSQLTEPWINLNRDSCNISHIKKFIDWFKTRFIIDETVSDKDVTPSQKESCLLRKLQKRILATVKDLVVVLVLLLRALGFDTRIVFSFQPVSLKEPKAKTSRNKEKLKTEESKEDEKDSVKASTSGTPKKPPQTKATTLSADTSTAKHYSARNQKSDTVTHSEKIAKNKRALSRKKNSTDSEESDFEEEDRKFRSPVVKKEKKNKRAILSSSEESDDGSQTSGGTDQWVEVYLPVKKAWVCIDCKNGKVDSPMSIEKEVKLPLQYVIAYDNTNNVKDVTRRYASDWLSSTRKLRVDADWWDESLKPYRPYYDEREEQEDNALQIRLMQKPLPTSVAAFKSHPLYALKRHLLKFEAIYPSTAIPVGYVKNEPVYARECVRMLHTKETWTKEGRAVRIGETPYKYVKARPKRNKPSDGAEQVAELFGEWQTEKYMPRPVYQGKVPRNEYGNVELFQPWMLPAGAVHLKIPGLNRVAKKLDIDCVPAMVGWDFHGGYNHPVFDGFVVCEEYKDVLLAAWDEENEIIKQREAEKREERVLKNWKRLIKGLVVKERLKKRYAFSESDLEAGPSKEKSGGSKEPEKVCAWPQNFKIKQTEAMPADQTELFPFEKM